MEEWRPVKGFGGIYEVSSEGRLRNVKTGRIHQNSKPRSGYTVDILCKGGTHKTVRRHQLVAEAFIPNPENKPEVNHKNGDKSDNSASNLEWVTHRENTDHAWLTGLTKLPTPEERAVIQFFSGKRLAEYRSIAVAANINRIDGTSILKCCKGTRPPAGGYEWRYKEDEDSESD